MEFGWGIVGYEGVDEVMSFEYKIREHVRKIETIDYLKVDKDEAPVIKVDCSFGVSPFGYSKKIRMDELINKVNMHSYPPFPYRDFIGQIIDYWKDVSDLKEGNITITDGTMGIIDAINTLFLEVGDKVLGYCPQFSEYVNSAIIRGAVYDPVHLMPESNYKFSSKDLIEKLKNDDYALVYIDNPNNPTGQVIDIKDIEEIVREARNKKVCVIVDEAYGDFMDKSNSAISLIEGYDNLFVLRSFSKGHGLAGMRLGYLTCSSVLSGIYGIIDDYLINPLGLVAGEVSLKDRSHIEESKERTLKVKGEIIESIGRLEVLHTNQYVPIFTVKHPEQSVDLRSLFLEHGVKVTSGFEGVGKNFARIRIPKESKGLIKVIKKIENQL